jgi:hypothetical protein
MRRFLNRLFAFLRLERADREMRREIASHLALMRRRFLRSGCAAIEHASAPPPSL